MNTATTTGAPIALTPIQSSQIAAIGYDAAANALTVAFKRRDGTLDSVYQYDGVTPDVHAALMGAESIGSHFIHNIKKQPESYPYRKLDSACAVIEGQSA